jgi:hypothetical protein
MSNIFSIMFPKTFVDSPALVPGFYVGRRRGRSGFIMELKCIRPKRDFLLAGANQSHYG